MRNIKFLVFTTLLFILILSVLLFYYLLIPEFELRFNFKLPTYSLSLEDEPKILSNKTHLEIKKLNLKQPIYLEEKGMNHGVWMKTSLQELGMPGRSVIVGHRFEIISGARPFFHLTKLKPDDEIKIISGNKTYRYKVRYLEKIHESRTDIESNTKGDLSELILYTCTHWNSEYRWVVSAILVNA
jgi:LPXTG-site transpeptidase (sortase) family protein